jgi:hypothetical protein
MGRLKNYLIEEKIELDEFVNTLWDECSEILTFYQRHKEYFYRGMRNVNMEKGYGFRITRTDRRPKDTPEDIQEMLDKKFKKKFGWKPRSEGVFANPDPSYASHYGKSVVIFPQNGFKYVWSPNIQDLYSDKIENYASYLIVKYQDIYSRKGYWHDNDSGDEYKNLEDIEGYVDCRIYNEGDPTYMTAKVTIKPNPKDEDGYTFIKNKVVDLSWVPKITWEQYYENLKSNVSDNIEDDMVDWINLYKDTGLDKAVKMNKEIMFKCYKYYWVLADNIKDFEFTLTKQLSLEL